MTDRRLMLILVVLLFTAMIFAALALGATAAYSETMIP